MGLLTQFKAEIKHAVESLYGFDTSRAPDIISRNAYRAQKLLTNMTFIYQVRHISSSFVGQLSIAMWVTGPQLWRAPSLSISTSHYPDSYQSHVVRGQGRRWDCLP